MCTSAHEYESTCSREYPLLFGTDKNNRLFPRGKISICFCPSLFRFSFPLCKLPFASRFIGIALGGLRLAENLQKCDTVYYCRVQLIKRGVPFLYIRNQNKFFFFYYAVWFFLFLNSDKEKFGGIHTSERVIKSYNLNESSNAQLSFRSNLKILLGASIQHRRKVIYVQEDA